MENNIKFFIVRPLVRIVKKYSKSDFSVFPDYSDRPPSLPVLAIGRNGIISD